MTEEELLRTAAKLGDSVARALDEQQLARRVLARLASEPSETLLLRRPRRRWLLGLAAAAAILLVLRLAIQPAVNSPAGPADAATTQTVLHELDDLSTAELEVLLETLPPAAGAAVHPDPGSFDELDAKALERLLRSLEG
jgi:hypothetical protein